MHKAKHRLNVLQTDDPKSLFHTHTDEQIYNKYGPTKRLLSRSAKGDKSAKYGYKSVVLYLTSGRFCPWSTPNCREVCLGHSSGCMTWPQAAHARDRKAAQYACDPEGFITQLKAEFRGHARSAKRAGLAPCVRLNGTMDISWELRHPDIVIENPDIYFY